MLWEQADNSGKWKGHTDSENLPFEPKYFTSADSLHPIYSE